ncbi:hypothetical protein [Microbulbifer celer]|uniref:hypothetical protein n=1 Tax=Microbulbifer celer TaxID=435905 RepID=UPI001F4A41CF|nr:hypothetical protein [Microbulbifer celer]
MNGKNWEQDFRRATDAIGSPDALDERIFSLARTYAPIKKTSRITSKAASGLGALAIAVILLHPAQYLGALTPAQAASDGFGSSVSSRERIKRQVAQPRGMPAADKWHSLRAAIKAGNLAGLCAQWRRTQRGGSDEALPADLISKAQTHCRLLP